MVVNAMATALWTYFVGSLIMPSKSKTKKEVFDDYEAVVTNAA